MEYKSLINKINLKNNISTIFSYIKNPNFIHKFFLHSKSLQQKLDLELVDYEKIYLEKSGINAKDYLIYDKNRLNKGFDKEIINKILTYDIFKSKLNYSLVYKMLIDIYEKYDKLYIKQIDLDKEFENDNIIDIYSPFFNMLSKMESFSFFSIFIPANIIGIYDLLNDYIKTFDILNKINSKYSSITFYYNDSHDIDYLKKLEINFNQIKRLHLKADSKEFKTRDYNYFFKEFFSIKNIEYSLIVLDLNVKWRKLNHYYEIETKLIEKINNFKLLEYLHINGFKLTNNFEFNLCSLKTLYIENSENISFKEKSFINLKVLKLIECSINHPNTLLEIPNLEICELLNPKTNNFYSIFNFSSCIKLKYAIMDPNDFIHLDNTLLEYIKLFSNIIIDVDIKKKTFEKLISIKTLKKIDFEFGEINNDEILLIKGENKSVKVININYVEKNKDLILFNLEKKFPNLSELNLESNKYSNNNGLETNLEIKENDNCKINKLILDIGGYLNIKFYCDYFENLNVIKLELREKIINLEEEFPLFNKKCNTEFKSLNEFSLICNYNQLIKDDIFKNLCNNLNKMPNLQLLYIDCIVKKFDEEFYKNLIRKILSFNLNNIYLSIKRDTTYKGKPYSKDELLEIYPNIDFSKYEAIYINDLNNENNILMDLY